ncbi:phosphoadenosine phosphosulfate reductase [filamentous cyanobacterium CCP5]|nr:phosphoadenosine phosphosulfate reductase [filamentous cyanobacterium CCP5]
MVQCMALPTRATDSGLDLDRLNREFEDATPQEILSWCIENRPEGLIQTSAFSLLAATHMLYRELEPQPPVPVIFLDTLHHFPETLETARQAQAAYNLDLRIYRPEAANTRQEFAQQYGDRLWEKDVVRFHQLTKIEPLARALRELEVRTWITGRRRDQSNKRQDMPIVEMDPRGYLKVNPLANWNRKQVWNYIYSQNVIYNPLHDQGYTSIGDEPLTTPVKPGESERAGRWRGSNKTECGIHV